MFHCFVFTFLIRRKYANLFEFVTYDKKGMNSADFNLNRLYIVIYHIPNVNKNPKFVNLMS